MTFVLSSIVFFGEWRCSLGSSFTHSESHNGFAASPSMEHCQALILAVGCLAIIIATLTSLPFLLRIRGVFNDSVLVVSFFSILWTILFLSALVLPLGIGAAHVQPVNMCLITRVARYTILLPIVLLLHDTCVFVAISAKLTTYPWRGGKATVTLTGHLISFFSGRGKEMISRAVLKTGQLYYLYVCFIKLENCMIASDR